MSIAKGTTVRFNINGKKAVGVVADAEPQDPAKTPVLLLPDFWQLLEEGKTGAEFHTHELTPFRVCACAHLAYRPQYGEHKGELFTTGCDFSRMPSRTSRFLPGHDAKAKGFLIRASQETDTLENGKGALETARELGDRISLKVAAGIDNARKTRAVKATSRRQPQTSRNLRPAAREDQLTEAQRLQRKLGVTDAMLRELAKAATNALDTYRGVVGGPTGTAVALADRKLSSWDCMTDLGYAVLDHPPLSDTHPKLVQCRDDEGAYARHASRLADDGMRRECRRCGEDTTDAEMN